MTKEELALIRDYIRSLPRHNASNTEPDALTYLRLLADALEQAWQEREALKESLEWAKNYDPFSSRACPLCTYEQGTLLKMCSLHTQIDELEADAETLALRLMGESESSFAPETHEVMTRWRVKCLKLIGEIDGRSTQ